MEKPAKTAAKNTFEVAVHDQLVAIAYIDGEAANTAIYWAGRVLDNLRPLATMQPAHRALAEILWHNVRFLGQTCLSAGKRANEHALHVDAVDKLTAWLGKHLDRMSEKQRSDADQFAQAVKALKEEVATIAAAQT